MTLPEYKSFSEKNQYFHSTRIETNSQFDRLYEELFEKQDHLIFRGLNESKFKNYTSAQRVWITNRLSYHIGFTDFIQRILDNIRSQQVLRDYYLALKVVPNDLLYLSFLQHYGAPTPMLDFTHDLDTGLFFAFDNMKPNSTRKLIGDFVSLYFIDIRECGAELVDMLAMFDSYVEPINESVYNLRLQHPEIKLDDSIIREIDKYIRWGTQGGFSNVPIGLYDGIFTNSTVTLKSGQTLVWANMNIIAQKGCFINYNDSLIPLERFLKNHHYLPMMHCVDIPKVLCSYIQKRINKKKSDIYPQEEEIAKNSYSSYLKTF